MNRHLIGSLVLLSAAMAAHGCFAADKLSVGDAAPQWTAITGTDDKPHGLADYKDAKALVVVFTCNHCPVATAYQERLIAVQNDYKDKGVQVIAICSNKGAADDLDAMKKRAESAGFNFPYLFDSTQQVCHDYGTSARPTPSSWIRTASWLMWVPSTMTCTRRRSRNTTSVRRWMPSWTARRRKPPPPRRSAALFVSIEGDPDAL